jgi:hypothetical protein
MDRANILLLVEKQTNITTFNGKLKHFNYYKWISTNLEIKKGFIARFFV